jgi:hypothetical protein
MEIATFRNSYPSMIGGTIWGAGWKEKRLLITFRSMEEWTHEARTQISEEGMVAGKY